MNEAMNARIDQRQFRWRLLTTASAAALASTAYMTEAASAANDEIEQPTIWIELGAQLEQIDGAPQVFAPPFVQSIVQANLTSPSILQRPPRYSNGAESRISFEPERSEWIFSASIRYGRSNGSREIQEQQVPITTKFTLFGNPATRTGYPNYSNAKAKQNEAHAIFDFQAGRDVGLGLFGKGGTSVVSGGVRFAQFNAKSTTAMSARPEFHFHAESVYAGHGKYIVVPVQFFHEYAGSAQLTHSFRGAGPSIAWDASLPFAGSRDSAEFTFDWGANAAVLFGRQKVLGHHQATGNYHYYRGHKQLYGTAHYQHVADVNRVHSVTVPDVGGFAGLSLKFPNAKVSLGYRGDFFFGAMDGGVDTVKKENRGFYGPFATISVGIGG